MKVATSSRTSFSVSKGVSGTGVGDCAQALNSINTTTNPKMVNVFFAATIFFSHGRPGSSGQHNMEASTPARRGPRQEYKCRPYLMALSQILGLGALLLYDYDQLLLDNVRRS